MVFEPFPDRPPPGNNPERGSPGSFPWRSGPETPIESRSAVVQFISTPGPRRARFPRVLRRRSSSSFCAFCGSWPGPWRARRRPSVPQPGSWSFLRPEATTRKARQRTSRKQAAFFSCDSPWWAGTPRSSLTVLAVAFLTFGWIGSSPAQLHEVPSGPIQGEGHEKGSRTQ